MPIPITCEYCEVSYRIADKAAGKRVRCKDCGEAIDVPGGSVRRAGNRSRSSAASPPERVRQSRSRSRTRSGSGESRDHIADRRERKYDDGGGSKNLIIGIACAAVALIGGGLFLFFGRGDGKDNDWVNPQAAQGIPGSMTREEFDADLAASKKRGEQLRDQITKEGQAIAGNANPDNWGSPFGPPPTNSTPPNTGSRPNFGPPPGFGMPPDFPGSRTARGSGQFGGRTTTPPRIGANSFPGNAETDEDFARLEEALLSGSRSDRSRAMSALGRSSQQERAAALLVKALGGADDPFVFSHLGRLGTAGEKQVLKIMAGNPNDDTLLKCLNALMQCGTDQCLSAVSGLKNHSNRVVGSLARAIEMRIKAFR